jgi:hypothetical protein
MDLGTVIMAVFCWLDECWGHCMKELVDVRYSDAEHRKKLLSTRCSHYGNHGDKQP